MATDAVRAGSRAGRKQAARAAKARREKILLAVCGVVLLGLLAFEGPKTLKRLSGSSAAPAPVVSTPSAASAPAAPVAHAASLKALRRFATKDPFLVQLGTGAGATAIPPFRTAPRVRTSHFVAKDPFLQQVTLSSSRATGPGKAGGKSVKVVGTGTYIVMVASVPLSEGRKAAGQAAAAARAHGVANVKIVDSTKYGTLRSGFWAVYSGPYPTLASTLKALAAVRAHGYVSAYTRQLGR